MYLGGQLNHYSDLSGSYRLALDSYINTPGQAGTIGKSVITDSSSVFL